MGVVVVVVPAELNDLAERLIDVCREHGRKVTAAESCTGGLVCAATTSVAGSSDVFEEGFVVYANEAKTRALGVPADLLAAEGAVSAKVAIAMAEGALARAHAHIAVAITGIAGPGGRPGNGDGTNNKPVGLVFIATAVKGGDAAAHRFEFRGGRDEIRSQAAARALGLCLEAARA